MVRHHEYHQRLDLLPTGSSFVRTCRHGELWRLPNNKLILIQTGSSCPRGLENLRAEIRRAMSTAP